jgi:monoamine oxidase
LPGGDVMITVGLDVLVRELAGDVPIAYDSPVRAIVRHGDGWCVRTLDRDLTADAVVVTVPVGVLKDDAIAFDPLLPRPLRDALSRIGAGLVTKAFFAFDTAYWAPRPAFWIASDPPALFELWVDVSAVRGAPTLCAFAVGGGALAVEQMSEDELLDAGWATLQSATGLVR